MANNKNNMDNFLRDSLGGLTAKPSQSVWKGITKRLIILELLRLNFTNVGKVWLYSGLATLATISGITYFSLTHQTEDTPKLTETPQTEQLTNNPTKTKAVEIVADAIDEKTPSMVNTKQSEMPNVSSESKTLKKNNAQEAVSEESISDANQTQSLSYKIIEPHEQIEEKAELRQLDKAIQESLQSKPIEYFTNLHQSKPLSGIGRLQPFASVDPEEQEQPPVKKKTNIQWFAGANYTPEWPLSNEDMFVNNHQLALSAGVEYKKWSFSLGFGLRTEKTPSTFMSHFSSYDSVGYYFDIDYYETIPDHPDSIIIFYSIESLYDSVAHQSEGHGPDQRRRWLFIPISLGYQVYAAPKYHLYANVFGQYGWQYYTEEADLNLKISSESTIDDITPEANTNYLQIGLGLENNFSIFPQWWIFAEPRINYYINTPYSINKTSGNGPYSFGIRAGIKYKFKRR
jgi:hypothetical protein